VADNRGVIDELIPNVLSEHQVLLPAVDEIGNDLGGIRVPFVEAPVATLAGWNLRREGFTEDDLCDLNGSTIPLYETREERLAAGDPRPSLKELYGSHRGYVRAVAMAARTLMSDRLMLQSDVAGIIREASESDVLTRDDEGKDHHRRK
jgi:hypothetical protein